MTPLEFWYLLEEPEESYPSIEWLEEMQKKFPDKE
jgi:hypothetical protein